MNESFVVTAAPPSKRRASEFNKNGMDERPPVPFYVMQQQSQQFRFYLSTEIEEPERYHQMCQVLRQAGEKDQVFIHLNSPGGQIDSTIQIISAIRDCKAEVITIADGVVASAATFIFLAGSTFIVNPHSLFMLHNFSSGTIGKGHEMVAAVQADVKWFTGIASEFYEGFLTKAEIRKLFKGEDFWFTADEVAERIQKRVAHVDAITIQRDSHSLKENIALAGQEIAKYLGDERKVAQLDRIIKCATQTVEKSATTS